MLIELKRAGEENIVLLQEKIYRTDKMMCKRHAKRMCVYGPNYLWKKQNGFNQQFLFIIGVFIF